MRLLILNQYALPRGASGITRHGDFGAVLASRGHRVHVIASRFNYLTRRAGERMAPTEGIYSGVWFRWLDTGSYARNDKNRIRSMVAYVLGAVRMALRRENRPDLVVASSPHLFTGVAGVAIAKWHRVPFVLEIRDMWPSVLVDLGALRQGSLMHRILEAVERWLYRRARLIIFVPPDGHRRLSEVGVTDARCVHIPNGTDVNAPAESVPDSLVSLLNELRGRSILMYAGAHGVANDLGTVISALDELRTLAPEIYAKTATVFIGDGSEKKALAERIAASGHAWIRMHPPIAKGAIVDALGRADALVVNVAPAIAHSYGLSPNKLFDYMAAGRPVLISSHVPTIADESGAGLRYDPGDAVGLARCIVHLFDMNIADRDAMGARGKLAVERDYTIEAVAGRLERALVDVLAR